MLVRDGQALCRRVGRRATEDTQLALSFSVDVIEGIAGPVVDQVAETPKMAMLGMLLMGSSSVRRDVCR